MRLKNKIAFVTAATRGIGLETVITLAKEGAKVYIAARNKDVAEKIITENKNLDLHYVHFDASDKNSINDSVNEVLKNEGRIDVLVNNFGGSDVTKDKTIFDTQYEDYINIFDRNLSSVFITSQNVCKHMMKIGGCSIINISTIGSIAPDISRIGYVSSKAAINSLTKNIALQGGNFGIRCNAVLPGLIETDAVKNNLPKKFIDMFLKSVPLKRPGSVGDIANTILFLASDESSYITGQTISVSGGFGNNNSPMYLFLDEFKK